MRILVTNDDGIDAPSLAPLARAISQLGEVTVVVPDRERSWVAKAITRFDPVHIQNRIQDGVEVTAVSGYPADAVQLGIHAFDAVPDLVVSGINLGYNHGTGFMMSSGTVGAAVEAWIAGIPAVAVSTGTMGDWHDWRKRALAPDGGEAWERLAGLTAELLTDLEGAGLHHHADVISINMPYHATHDTERRITTIARVGYDRLFSPQPDGSYAHAYGGGITEIDPVEGSDIDAAHDGAVSITPIRLPEAATIPEEIRRTVERR